MRAASHRHRQVVVVVEEARALGLAHAKLALQVLDHVALAGGRREEVELSQVHRPVDALRQLRASQQAEFQRRIRAVADEATQAAARDEVQRLHGLVEAVVAGKVRDRRGT